MYYDHSELLHTVPLNTAWPCGGARRGVLTELSGPDERVLEVLGTLGHRSPVLLRPAHRGAGGRIQPPDAPVHALEMLLEIMGKADDEAILRFEKNPRNLLMLPSAATRWCSAWIPASGPAARPPWWT